MAGKGSKKHIHKYHRVRIADVYVWACALDDCTHYMPKHMENMIPGKASVCWECKQPVCIMGTDNMDSDNPVCIDCASGVTASAADAERERRARLREAMKDDDSLMNILKLNQ